MKTKGDLFFYLKQIWNNKINLIILPALFLLNSCGVQNGNDYDKKIIQAKEAITQELFTEAIGILSSLPENREVMWLKSIAYSGRAGIRTLEIVDIIENNKNPNPGVIIKDLANRYGNTEINDSRLAINYINKINQNIAYREKELNLQYAVVHLYKSSQILLNKAKLAEEGRFSEIWDPCLEAELLSIDIREIISSINRALEALSFANKQFYSHAMKIQEDLKINIASINEQLVSIPEINNFRTYIKEKIVLPQSSALSLEEEQYSDEDVCPNLSNTSQEI